jgi:hypothetical protein
MQAYDDDFDDASLLGVADAFGASRAAFDALTATLGSAEAGCWTHDQLEDHLERHGRELLRRLLQDHLDLRALREQHAVQHAVAHGRVVAITDAEGIGHRKVEPGHLRHLATVFGTVQVTRCAWRADGARNLYPADAALNLPDRLHSHTLQRRAALEAVRGSFDTAQQALTRQCGNVAGKRQVEQLTMAAASDIDAFYPAAAPLPSSDDTLLVLSVDGKGVVMRPEALREPTRKAAAAKPTGTYQTRLASGEKQGRKRMATLGTVYDADPAPRRPHDVMTPAITINATADGDGGGGRRRRQGPVATAKWLTGSIATTPSRSSRQSSTKPPSVTRPTAAPGSCWSTAPATNSTSSAPKPSGAACRSTSSSTSSMSWSMCGAPPGASTTTATRPPNPGSPPTPCASWLARQTPSSPRSTSRPSTPT